MNNRDYDRIGEFIHIVAEALGKEAARVLAEKLGPMGFFEAPASTRFHSAYPGGLYDHSREVTVALLNLTHDLGLEWGRPESPYLIGMLHDGYKKRPRRSLLGRLFFRLSLCLWALCLSY